jgi:hypothetical protein
MLLLVMAALLFLALTLVGFVVKGLLWLALFGAAALVAVGIYSAVRHNREV